jgi:predicted amidohydrolase
MKIAMVQMNVVSGNIEQNRRHGVELTRLAAETADVIVLPELWTSGYSLRQVAAFAETEAGPTLQGLLAIARNKAVVIIGGSFAYRQGSNVYNGLFVVTKDGIVADYQKIHLFSMFNEGDFFAAGQKFCLFDLAGQTAGAAICYDLRFPEIFRSLALQGASIIFVPAEWPTARGDNWRVLVQARAIENQIFICAVNCVGQHKNQPFFGHSLLVGPDGTIVTEGDAQENIFYGEVDFTAVDKVRRSMTILTDRRGDLY